MITIITGIPGAGKTSLLAKIAVENMLNGRERYNACRREFSLLNSTGCNLNLPNQKHLVFSDFPVRFGRRCQTYDIDGYRIGFLSPLFKNPAYIPPYSIILLDEAQRYYDSRMSRSLREEVYRWYQLHRHDDLDVYLTCQRLGNIDINIRAIAERFIVVDNTELKKDDFGIIRKIIWYYHEFVSGDIAEKYQLEKDRSEFGRLGRDIFDCFDFDIFRCYSSKGGRPAYFRGLVNTNTPIDYYTDEGYQFTRESFVEYNNKHYFTAPLGFWKNPERDKKILKELGITDYEY